MTTPAKWPNSSPQERLSLFEQSCAQVARQKKWMPNAEELDSESKCTVVRSGDVWVKFEENMKAISGSSILHKIGLPQLAPLIRHIELTGEIFSKWDIDPETEEPLEFELMTTPNKTKVLVEIDASKYKIEYRNDLEVDNHRIAETVKLNKETYLIENVDDTNYKLVQPWSELSALSITKGLLRELTTPDGKRSFTPDPIKSEGRQSVFTPVNCHQSPTLITDGLREFPLSPKKGGLFAIDEPQKVIYSPPALYRKVIGSGKNKKEILVEEEATRILTLPYDGAPITEALHKRSGNATYHLMMNEEGNYFLQAKKLTAQVAEHIEGAQFEVDGQERIKKLDEASIHKQAFIVAYIAYTILGNIDGRIPNFIWVQQENGQLSPVFIDFEATLPDSNQYRVDQDARTNDIAPHHNALNQYSITRATLTEEEKNIAKTELNRWTENQEKITEILTANKIEQITIDALKERIDRIKIIFEKLNEPSVCLQDFEFSIFPENKLQWDLLQGLPFEDRSEKVGCMGKQYFAVKTLAEAFFGQSPIVNFSPRGSFV